MLPLNSIRKIVYDVARMTFLEMAHAGITTVGEFTTCTMLLTGVPTMTQTC